MSKSILNTFSMFELILCSRISLFYLDDLYLIIYICEDWHSSLVYLFTLSMKKVIILFKSQVKMYYYLVNVITVLE